MLVWVTLVSGIAVCLLGSLAVVRMDRRWRRRHLRCSRCRRTWFGEDVLCGGCGARGNPYDWRAERSRDLPAHGRQGLPGTATGGGAVAPVAVAGPGRVDLGDRAWAAPAVPAPRPAPERSDEAAARS